MANRRSNNNRRTRRYRRPSGNQNSIRHIFKKRVQNIRNRPYMRPRRPGFSNVTSNVTKRLIMYPSSGAKPDPQHPAPSSSWWLDKLEWFASIALQLAGVFIAASPDEDSLKFYITGAATRVAITPIFLLMSSPMAIIREGKLLVPFEQFRILWVKIFISPIVDSGIRGGSYVSALVPIAENEAIDDVSTDYDIVMRQPGSVIRPIDKPCSVSWSPSLLEYGIKWHDISDTDDRNVCVFVIAFSDLATNKADAPGSKSDEYNPHKASFEVIVESRIELRRPGLTTHSINTYTSDPTVISVTGINRRCEIPFDKVNWNNGLGTVSKADVIEDFDMLLESHG